MEEVRSGAVYTIAELPKLMKLGKTSVYGLVRTGELRSVRVGRRYIIPGTAIEQYLAERNKQ